MNSITLAFIVAVITTGVITAVAVIVLALYDDALKTAEAADVRRLTAPLAPDQPLVPEYRGRHLVENVDTQQIPLAEIARAVSTVSA